MSGLICSQCGEWTSGRYGPKCVFCVDYKTLVEESHRHAEEDPELFADLTKYTAERYMYGVLDSELIT